MPRYTNWNLWKRRPSAPVTGLTALNQQANPTLRELDQRKNDGIEVTLLWNSRTSQVHVAVVDSREGTAFELEVAAEDAREAFHHPYAFAPRVQETLLAA